MKRSAHLHKIEIKLRNLSQLFNSLDPAPFHEKDLDDDAEEYITSWVQEYPRHDPVTLVIHLEQPPENPDAKTVTEQAVHHYFGYRARLIAMEFNRLMRQGRTSLLIGLAFLTACLFAVEAMGNPAAGTWLRLLQESLTIGGWVAMWRPLEIYLYEWWPLRRRWQIFRKMSRMPVELKLRPPATHIGVDAPGAAR